MEAQSSRSQVLPDKALQFLAQNGRNAATAARPRRAIVGSPQTVRKGIEDVARLYQADEVMVGTITYDHRDRRRSYELIAEEFGLATKQTSVSEALVTPGR